MAKRSRRFMDALHLSALNGKQRRKLGASRYEAAPPRAGRELRQVELDVGPPSVKPKR